MRPKDHYFESRGFLTYDKRRSKGEFSILPSRNYAIVFSCSQFNILLCV